MRATRTVMAGIALGVIASTTACSVGLEDLPLPAPGVSGDSYRITATFANALNLPAAAKVKSSGVDVGEVESMAVDNYAAVVTLRILDGVELPVGTTAELRSATPLGDIFVAITPPAEPEAGAPLLGDGDNIPLESTSAAATIEGVLSTAAILVNGGVLRDTTKIVNGLGSAVGDHGDGLADLIGQSTQLVGNLAARSGELQDVLARTGELSDTLSLQQGVIDDLLTAASPATGTVSDNTDPMLTLLDQIDRITQQLQKFPSIAGTNGRGLVADVNTIADQLARAANDPDADLDAVSRMLAPIINVTASTSAHTDADLQDLSIGALADPGHTADPGSRIPDATDAANLAGTIAYTLQRLRDRVIGPGR